MDNIGYNNWNSQDVNNQSFSSDGSPPSYQPSSRAARNRNDYSFDLSRDDSDDQLLAKGGKKTATTGFSYEKKDLSTRRVSTEDRTKELLSRFQKNSSDMPHTQVTVSDSVDDPWMQMRSSIMAGVSETTLTKTASIKHPSPKEISKEASLDMSDSFELDDTDLQVGAYAARKSMEKTAERKQSLSLKNEQAALVHSSPSKVTFQSGHGGDTDSTTYPRMKVDESPNVRRSRRPSYSTNMPGFQMSQALSSIDFGERKEYPGIMDSDDGQGGMVRFGSIEKSDNDLYNVLSRAPSTSSSNLSVSTKHSGRRSNLSEEDISRIRGTTDIHSHDSNNSGHTRTVDISADLESSDQYSDSGFEQSEEYSPLREKETAASAVAVAHRSSIEEIQARWSNPDNVLKDLVKDMVVLPKPVLEEEKIIALDAQFVCPDASSRYAKDYSQESDLSLNKGSSLEQTSNDSEERVSEQDTGKLNDEMDEEGDEESDESISPDEAYRRSLEDIPIPPVVRELEEPDYYSTADVVVVAEATTIEEVSPLEQDEEKKVELSIPQIPAISSPLPEKEKVLEVPESSSAIVDSGFGFPRYRASVEVESSFLRDLPTWKEDDLPLDDASLTNHTEQHENEEEVIYYPDTRAATKHDTSLTSKYRKLQNSKPSPARSKHVPTEIVVQAIQAVEVNPAFFGFSREDANDSQKQSDVSESQAPKKRLGSIPILPPNLDELRAQLRVLHTTTKRKVSPIKKTAPSRPTLQASQGTSKLPQPSKASRGGLKQAPPAALSVPEVSTSRSQSPRPRPMVIEEDLSSKEESSNRLAKQPIQFKAKTVLLPPAPQVSSRVGTDEVLVKMVETLQQSSHLSLREIAVHEREKALAEREISMLSSHARRGVAEKFEKKDADDAALDATEKEHEWIVKERRLQAELESMKATMFQLQTEKEAALLNHRKYTLPVEDEIVPDGSKITSRSETVTIPRSEYDSMVKELGLQESLITGFQKENDKLVAQLKERESEEAYQKAKFFDKTEMLNKELNRLRNVAGVDADGLGDNTKPEDSAKYGFSRRSSDMVRADLDKDAQLEYLKERLEDDKIEHSIRVKQLQDTIDKLRVENKRLDVQAKDHAMSTMAQMDLKASFLLLQSEKRRATEECDALRAKLKWYGENQQLLESSDSEKLELRSTILSLKKELQSLKANKAGDTDMSFISNPNKSISALGGGRKSGRDPADIKKIEDLKRTLSDLQDSITKRYPDSVATLIQASKVSDSVEAEHVAQAKNLEKATDELGKAKQEFERRLRSLRQEHEKVKMQYEERIKNLQGSLPPTAPLKLGAVSGSANKDGKIRELEKEVERIRTFYTKKLEDVQRKADTQLRSLKRGDKSDNDEAFVTIHASAVAQFELRISMLEQELIQTSEELGRARAMAVSVANNPPTPPSPPPPVPAIVAMASPPVMHIQQPSLFDPNAELNIQKVNSLNERITELTSQANMARFEASEKSKALELATVEISSLRTALDDAKAELHMRQLELAKGQSQASNTPQMAHFVAVEGQVQRLEEKIARRESELQSLIEETKAAGRMERSRLQSIHAQELLEKDEQLARFQRELEDLVGALRRYSLRGDIGTFAGSSGSGASTTIPII